MGKAVSVQVTGAKEARKSLKSLGDGAKPAGKMLRGAYLKTSDYVAERSRASASGSRMGHIASGSIKPRATQTSGSVQAYKGVPWGGGHEYGSGRYRQFPAVNKGGYHIYPTIAAEGPRIVEIFAESYDEFARSVGLS